jgi:peptidoglycan hydrolase CwlO-like protein
LSELQSQFQEKTKQIEDLVAKETELTKTVAQQRESIEEMQSKLQKFGEERDSGKSVYESVVSTLTVTKKIFVTHNFSNKLKLCQLQMFNLKAN